MKKIEIGQYIYFFGKVGKIIDIDKNGKIATIWCNQPGVYSITRVSFRFLSEECRCLTKLEKILRGVEE